MFTEFNQRRRLTQFLMHSHTHQRQEVVKLQEVVNVVMHQQEEMQMIMHQ